MRTGRRLLLLLGVALAGCSSGGGNDGRGEPPPSIPVATPSISSLEPEDAVAAGSDFVLTVYGSGFAVGAVIQWNGGTRATTYVSSAALQAPIASSDVATAGTATITVVNPAPNGGTSNAVPFVVNNPSPSISAASPTFVAPGGPAFVLTIDGSGFVAASVVRWNGADRPTTFVSGSRLTAAIAADDIASQSTAQVSVFNAAPGGGTSNTATILVGNPVPRITQLAPAVVRPNSGALMLQILGSSYVDGAVVRLNGLNLDTSFISSTEVHASIPAAHLAGAALAEVVAVNPAPGGGTSNAVTLTIAPYGVTTRLSVASDGSEANGDSDNPSMSADGRFVAFTSTATNLVPADTNGSQDVFVRDTCSGAAGCTPSTIRVSVDSGGNEPNGAAESPAVSGDGRFVAFASAASNLVPGDSNGVKDVFVRDTCAGAQAPCTPATTRVSVAADGSQGNLASSRPSISADGRFIAFLSNSILVLGDINNVSDAFVRDTCFDAPPGCVPSTIRASTATDAAANNQGVGGVAIGADSRFVAFSSLQQRPGETIRVNQVHVADTCTAVSTACTPATVLAAEIRSSGNLDIYDRSVSRDGRFVAIEFVNDTGGVQTWLANTCVGAASRCAPSFVQVSPAIAPLLTRAAPSISPDGRFIAFGDRILAAVGSVAVRDTCFGAPSSCAPASVTISETDGGAVANASSEAPTMDSSGQFGAFASTATNLVPADSNGRRDIFLARTGFTLR